jgi:hypothetical protein
VVVDHHHARPVVALERARRDRRDPEPAIELDDGVVARQAHLVLVQRAVLALEVGERGLCPRTVASVAMTWWRISSRSASVTSAPSAPPPDLDGAARVVRLVGREDGERVDPVPVVGSRATRPSIVSLVSA